MRIRSARGAAWLFLLTGCLLVLISFSNRLNAEETVVLDFPNEKADSSPLPAGLAAWPSESSQGLPTVEIPLLAINQEGSLLVTVIFRDNEGSVIQAGWKTADGKKTALVSNLSEGIKGWNQRTFKVSYDLLQQAGTLSLEAESGTQPVKRVALAWTWPTAVFMSPQASAVEYVADTHRVFTNRELDASKPGPIPDTWSGGVWKAFLQEKPETLEEDISFSFPMENAPGTAILRAKLLGFPLNTPVPIWVNGKKVDSLSAETPDLTAIGYYKTGNKLNYAGWREAAVVIPAQYFQVGANAIVLKAQKGAYIKDAQLELNFEKEGAPMAIADAGTSSSNAAQNAGQPASNGPAIIGVPTENP